MERLTRRHTCHRPASYPYAVALQALINWLPGVLVIRRFRSQYGGKAVVGRPDKRGFPS